MAIVATPQAFKYYQGMRANLNQERIRYCNDENLAEVDTSCGIVVVQAINTTLSRIAPATAAGQRIRGVSYTNFYQTLKIVNGVYLYEKGLPVSILEEGEIIMRAERPVKVNDPVYHRFAVDTTNGFTVLGALSNIAGTGLELLPNARFLKITKVADLVPVRINIL